MTDGAEHYARLYSILDGARRLTGEPRDAYLAEACGDDAVLRGQVQKLLAAGADDESDDLFAETRVELARQSLETVLDGASMAWLPESIGDYRILGQIGRGGMGVVYEAQQESPRRRVAIKLLHPMQVTPERLRRFRHEAELLGRLQHPGIAQIFEAGTYDVGRGEQPFFAMELVDGVDIRTYCERNELDIAARIDLLARVADAVQYAHEREVIHRDLKPDNVLVNEDRQPRILDFGIARASGESSTLSTLLTAEGQLVGTLAYMAPELLRQEADAVTSQVDVYALGVLAFELLAGRPPREIDDMPIPQAIAFLAANEPPRASAFDAKLRGDVETILGKALESDRARRYTTPSALAADLRRHLAHQPILARPPSRTYLVRKFARRNKALVGGVVTTLLVAIAGALIATNFALDANRRANALERAGYVAGLAVANSAIDRQDYTTAAEILGNLPGSRRGWEMDYLRARLVHHEEEWELPAPLAGPLAFDAEGRRMFGVLADHTLATWDVASGRWLGSASLHPGSVPASLVPHRNAIHGPTGTVASVHENGDIVISTLAGIERQRVTTGTTIAGVHVHEWDSLGERLLYSADTMYVWNGTESRPLGPDIEGLGAFDHAGRRIAHSGELGRGITLVDALSGDELATCRLNDPIIDLAFSPTDEFIAAAGYSGNAFLLDADTLKVEARLSGHQRPVHDLSWSADGTRLVTAARDGSIRIWNPRQVTDPVVHEAGTGADLATYAAFLPGRPHVVVGRTRARCFLVENTNVLRGHASYVYRLSFSPDGSLLASSAWCEGLIHVWDVARGELRARYPAPKHYSGGAFVSAPIVDFTADGQQLVGSTSAGLVRYDLRTGAALPAPPPGASVEQHLEFLGRRDARATANGEARSPDGRWLASCGESEVVLFDAGQLDQDEWVCAQEGQLGSYMHAVVERAPHGRLQGHVGSVFCAAFTPDGSRIATGGRDTAVRIWDVETCELLLVLRGHDLYVMDLQFSPDGTVLASASGDMTIRLWDTLPLHERRALAK